MKTSILLLPFLAFAGNTTDQTPTRELANPPALVFRARPTKHLFARGEEVVFSVSIRNQSAGPIFVSRLLHEEFVDFNVSGPDGKEVPWQGKGRIDSKRYSPSDFTVLKGGEQIRAKKNYLVEEWAGVRISQPRSIFRHG
jgi:hypothetical protein